MHKSNSLISVNIHFLNQGIDILKYITDSQYTFNDTSHHSGSIGQHMRHVVDHYSCFLKGIDGKINYDARARDPKIESSRENAIRVVADQTIALRKTEDSENLMDREILVKSNEGVSVSDTSWSSSTIKRELQFLISHTVHHYALIALILRLQDINPPKDFGVAPSTLEYRRTCQQSQE